MDQRKYENVGNVTIDYTYYSGEDLYSEGEAEDHLLELVTKHHESEYERVIQNTRSWSVMYHLSHIRENVISWIPFKDSDSVLEIGAGCGAVTGELARRCKSVTCIDLSRKRSLINATRHKEYDNLTLMVGNFEDIEPNLTEKYDYITLIGVYEYASSYIAGDDPYHEMLNKVARHLKDDGKIIIAIENRLGLKYFAGCKEDHLGRYFAGIEGYTESDGVRTFSKNVLSNLITDCGFYPKFYYPYPDYKLPHTIYSDDRLPGIGDLNTNRRNFDADRIVLFDETKAFNVIIEEGRFANTANSFLVMAAKEKDWDKKIPLPIYSKYANERMDKFRTSTDIVKYPDGHKDVYKKALTTHANSHIRDMFNNCERLSVLYKNMGLVPNSCSYIPAVVKNEMAGVPSKGKDRVRLAYLSGITMEQYFEELEAAGEYGKMEDLLTEYVKRLSSSPDCITFEPNSRFNEVFGKRTFSKNYLATNPTNYDVIFSNIVFDREKKEEGPWNVLDYEWVFDFTIPIPFLVYRAIFYQFGDGKSEGFKKYLADKGCDVYSLCGIDIGERLLFKEMEHSFQMYIIGGAASLEVMQVMMPCATMYLDRMIKIGSYLKNLNVPKIYYSRIPFNFDANNQMAIIADAEDGLISMRIPIESNMASLRIDPTEYKCILSLDFLRLVGEDGVKKDADRLLVNGYIVSPRTYIFDTDDSQMIIDNIPAGTKSVEIAYRVTMFEDVFYDAFLAKCKAEEERKKIEEQALSYKIKRRIGVIKPEILPEGLRSVTLTT